MLSAALFRSLCVFRYIMNWIDKLEKRFGGFAIQNLALYLVAGQVIVWSLVWFKFATVDLFMFNPILFAQGQIWRAFTFIFVPPVTMHPIFLAFAWYIFWMMSSALEREWGVFKYNLFIWLAIIFTLVSSLIFPRVLYSNNYIALTVFFAFATLYPDFEFLMFFILPVKVKWLALLALAGLLYSFAIGTWPSRVIILVSVSNYLLFFGRDLYQVFYLRKRRMEHQKKVEAMEEEPFHSCGVCGATDKSNPERSFRYREGKGICEVCLEKEASADG